MKAKKSATKKMKYPYFVYVDAGFKQTEKYTELANYFVFADDIKNALQLALEKSFEDGIVGDLGGRDIHEFDGATLGDKTVSELAPNCVTLTYEIEDHHAGLAELYEPEDDGAWVQLEAFSPASGEFWEKLEDDDDVTVDDLMKWARKNPTAAKVILQKMQEMENSESLHDVEEAARFMAGIEAIAIGPAIRKNLTARKSSPKL